MASRRHTAALWAAGGAAVLMLGVALVSGSTPLSIGDVSRALLGGDSGTAGTATGAAGAMSGSAGAMAGEAADIVWRLRLPRALAAFACGGLLALSGALLQTLLRNPLAEPYLLGVSGGAAVGALLVMWIGAALTGVSAVVSIGAHGVPIGAAAGALSVTALLMLIARRDFSDHASGTSGIDSGRRLLLAGVALASVCGAAVALILSLAPDTQLRGMIFWLMGDLSSIPGGVDGWGVAMVVLAGALAITWPQAHALNVLTRGEAVAQTLGVNVQRLRITTFIIAAVAAAAAVATAGAIGFAGLVAPHLMRLALGNDQRVLLPASVLGGGTLLLFADTIARTVMAPAQLPTGAVMALIGAPVFLHLLFHRRA